MSTMAGNGLLMKALMTVRQKLANNVIDYKEYKDVLKFSKFGNEILHWNNPTLSMRITQNLLIMQTIQNSWENKSESYPRTFQLVSKWPQNCWSINFWNDSYILNDDFENYYYEWRQKSKRLLTKSVLLGHSKYFLRNLKQFLSKFSLLKNLS